VLESFAIRVFGTVLAVILVFVWIAVFVLTMRGVARKDILWKDAGEDRDEGGYVSKHLLIGGVLIDRDVRLDLEETGCV
jgi:uncharacterized membrane protein YqiK